MEIHIDYNSLIFFTYLGPKPSLAATRQAETPIYRVYANYMLAYYAYWQSSRQSNNL